MIDLAAIFLAWLERTPLPVRVVVEEVKPSHISFRIDGWPCLEGTLGMNGINIFAVRAGETWDIIWDSDLLLQEFEGGWGCSLCIDAWEKGLFPKPASHASPEALWIEHTLEPFRGWLEKLAASAGIVFIDYKGATEARLLQEGETMPKRAVDVVRRSSSATG